MQFPFFKVAKTMRPTITPPRRRVQPSKNRSLMFRLTIKASKYYLFALFGYALGCLVGAVFGFFPTIALVMPHLNELFIRLAALLLCLMAIAVLVESLRQ